jgi:hypothetical protein
MPAGIESHIAAVEALYKPLVMGEAVRFHGGTKLWKQFEKAANVCRAGNPAGIAALIERVNDLAVARLIPRDPSLEDGLQYEPDLIADGRRIDFVVFGAT